MRAGRLSLWLKLPGDAADVFQQNASIPPQYIPRQRHHSLSLILFRQNNHMYSSQCRIVLQHDRLSAMTLHTR